MTHTVQPLAPKAAGWSVRAEDGGQESSRTDNKELQGAIRNKTIGEHKFGRGFAQFMPLLQMMVLLTTMLLLLLLSACNLILRLKPHSVDVRGTSLSPAAAPP